MKCGMECTKYLLFIFNFLLAIGGLAIIIIAVVLLPQVKNVTELTNLSLSVPTILALVIGGIIFVIAFFGCCGAIRESHCMIITFAVLMLTAMIIQVALSAYLFVQVNKGETTIVHEAVKKSFDSYYTDSTMTAVIDAFQKTEKCCGYESYHEFNPIPASCCKNSQNKTCSDQDIFSTSCKKVVDDLISHFGKYIPMSAILVAALELIGIIFALCLANAIRNAERRGYKV